jgi:hypothetical protein
MFRRALSGNPAKKSMVSSNSSRFFSESSKKPVRFCFQGLPYLFNQCYRGKTPPNLNFAYYNSRRTAQLRKLHLGNSPVVSEFSQIGDKESPEQALNLTHNLRNLTTTNLRFDHRNFCFGSPDSP